MRYILLAATLSLLHAQTAVFPGAVVTNGQLMIAANNVQVTLAVPITPTSTVLTVGSVTGIVPNTLLTFRDTGEIVSICAVTGNVLSVGYGSCPSLAGRAFDGSTAVAHQVGAQLAGYSVAWYPNSQRVEIEAIESTLGANAANVKNLPLINQFLSFGSTQYSLQQAVLGAPSLRAGDATATHAGVNLGVALSAVGSGGIVPVQQNGIAPCLFDGTSPSPIAGDYVTPLVGGHCFDAGASAPSNAIGIVVTNGSPGTVQQVLLTFTP